MSIKTLLASIVYLNLLWNIYYVRSDDTISVRIKNGLINGRKVEFNGQELNEFLGIPYAKPPIDELRFKKPLPVEQWAQPIDALHWPKPCIHTPKYTEDYRNKDLSEDCLYLNIWSPNVYEVESALRPVMLFIHGGALLFGSSVASYYSGHVLSSKGDVVVVTFNYRLSVFGFLYTGSDYAPGNMGLWDQALALEWVNDNIQYFGGDSKRITIFGESAGSWSTTFHILSPVTRNMFQNAIAMSGAVINSRTPCKPEVVLKMWFKFANIIGCNDSDITDETNTKFTPKMIECFRLTSAEKLSEIVPPFDWHSCETHVIIDGQLITDSPLKMLKRGDFKNRFNLLIGTVEDEGSHLLSLVLDRVRYDRLAPTDITYMEARKDLKALTSKMIANINDEEVAKLYFSGLSDHNSADILRRTVGIAIGDYILGCPTILFAENVFRYDRNTNVFQYYYNSKLGEGNPFCSPWMGCCHFSDIFPVFGVPFADPDRYVDREREISLQVIDIFSTFAKTGRPSKQLGAEWNNYYTINESIIRPYYEISSEQKNITNFGIGLKINECEYLWSEYLERE